MKGLSIARSRSFAAGLFAALAFASVVGCAPVPRPPVLAEIEQVRKGAAVEDAKANAPGGFEHAEKLRREADAAFEAGDIAGAQILGERALAAYAHAHALARIARAEVSSATANAALSAAKSQLTTIDADQTRVSAELSAAELRLKVATDAQPVVPSGAADAEREKARMAAARSLALQAKILCGAARLLLSSSGIATVPSAAPPAAAAPSAAAPSSSSAPRAAPPTAPAADPAAQAQLPGPALAAKLDEAIEGVTKLESTLSTAAAAPIDQASRARAACLTALTYVRRASTPVTRAPGSGDALLTELSAAGTWSPSRDDRGVVITLRGLFKGDALTAAGAARLAELGRVSAAHPSFPLVVVLHHDKEVAPKDEAALAARADRVVRALHDAKAVSVLAVQARAAAPVVDPAGAERARNARVEVVFVTPETF